METVKKLLNNFSKWEYSGLCLLVLVILVLHFSIIMQPDEPLFDEKHYVPDAKLIIQGEGTERLEHPPLGKLFIVSGIKLFGDNPFGWRFFSVLLGTASIILFYLICRQLNLSKKVSFLATFLLALENLSFVQASIAMLDVYSLFFMMLSFWLYLKGRYVMSGVAVGLSALAKLNGALAILVIGLHWFLTVGWIEIGNRLRSLVSFLKERRQRWHFMLRFLTEGKHLWRFLLLVIAAPITFIGLMPLFDFAIWHKWLNPVEQIETMLRLSATLTYNGVSPDIGSRPWEWILFPEVMPYWWTPHYTGMISPTLWALIIPVVVYITYKAIKGNTPVLFPFSWFLGTYLLWIPLSLITDRVTYIFYIYPTIGAIAIGLSMALFRLCDISKGAVASYLLLHIIAFIIIAPVSLWWSIPFCLLIYIFAFRFLDLGKGLGFRDKIALPENQVDKPSEQ